MVNLLNINMEMYIYSYNIYDHYLYNISMLNYILYFHQYFQVKHNHQNIKIHILILKHMEDFI